MSHKRKGKKRLSRSPSALGSERSSKRQKTISNRWKHRSMASSLEAQERKKRLEQFLAVKNLTTADDESNTLCKKTVFEATQNKQRNDISIKAELEAYMKKVDASKHKIQKDLNERLRKKELKKKLNKLPQKQQQQSNEDSLDSFMKKIETDSTKKKTKKSESERIYNDESKFDEGDLLISDDESFVFMEAKNKKKIIKIDHSKVKYPKLRKNVYVESPQISAMSWADIKLIRSELLSECNVTVCKKQNDIKPILKWTQCGLSDDILRRLSKFKYAKPFAVQCQAIPAVMSGNDLICVASTGSGKTLSFILPLFRHCFYNHSAETESKPICIILVPTRELCQQIMCELNKFKNCTSVSAVTCCALYGGVSIAEQIKKIKNGTNVIVATPGRLIECLCANNGRLLDIRYVSYFVMDEADRLFDLGFESQITSILDNVRPDKQLLMFSATFPSKIEKIARKYFNNANTVQITFSSLKDAPPSSSVAQFVYISESDDDKFKALLRLLSEWYGHGQILIFVSTRSEVDFLFAQLCDAGYFALTLHGGINQIDRDYTMIDFKAKTKTILICTSVASRGLDVDDLRVVINYFPPHHYEDYVHRIGRTGRAQERGVAYTFINKAEIEKEAKCLPHIVKAMKASNIEISKELNDLCRQYYDDLNCGKQAIHRNAGYDGKGFKYDDSEKNAKKKEIERQKYVYGQREELQEWNLKNKNEVTQIEIVGSNAQKNKKKTKSLEEELAAIKEAKNDNPLNRNLETLKKALLAAKKKKKRMKKLKKSDKKIVDLKKTIDRTIQNEQKKHEKNTKDRVESIAKIISMSFDQNNGGNAQQQTMQNGQMNVFKVDINEYPANARKAVTYSNNLVPIKENYNVSIIQKGTFIPNGRKVQKGQSSLYLEVKGANLSNVRAAIKELQQILHREAAKANHSMQNNRYSKFKVV